MPGKIKVKVLAGRNLPVMDRASDTTDAFVEIKFGGVTHKTDVCRKSLNPHWSSTEWYRFEVDESELQDEPLQLRLMDHDTYSANDAIGKVVISLAPLLAREANNAKGTTGPPGGAVLSGWIPVFDTMHGIRGELNVIVKVELFSDFNKYKTSSCGVQFFHCPMIPPGYRASSIHGFVEELVVNDDPEYQWIDKIRTPRASNEARQVAFIKLSNQVQRLVGLKAAELGANAVVGYQQEFDLEGEAGVVARAIGTAVSITPMPTPTQPVNVISCTQQQLKKCLDILATDDESVTDLSQYYKMHQDELQKMVNLLNPKGLSMLDEQENADDDDDKSTSDLVRLNSLNSYAGSVSLYQDDYMSQRSMRHLSEDQTDLNKLLNRKDEGDSDSSDGPIQKIKKLKTNFFTKRFSKRREKQGKQDDTVSIKSNSSDTSRISLIDIKNELKKFKRIKKPKFHKAFANKEDEGEGMASILARSVIHARTSLACIAETQDSENSPCSTMRRTSGSEHVINVSDDDKKRITVDTKPETAEKKVPEIHFSSLKNIGTEDVPREPRVRRLSESCPTSPVAGRCDNLLKLPGDKGYFGSVSSALSGESSLYSSSEDDEESSDLKTDTDEALGTTSSIVNSVMRHESDPAFIAQMDRKLTVLKNTPPKISESVLAGFEKRQETQDVVEKVEITPTAVEIISNSEKEREFECKIDKPEDIVDNQPKMSSAADVETCVPKPNTHYIKIHNPFANRKTSASISCPSSPVEQHSFVYRSSKRIKNQLSKISNSNMIKSISHISLFPKKKEVKGSSQPGSSSNVPSKCPSETVLGSHFLSYSDLIGLDKDTLQSNKLCKSDEIAHSKFSMYIGSEPVSRCSLSGPSHPHSRDEHDHHKKEKHVIKPTGLIHTAMETMLIDKVESLLIPTSPEPGSVNSKFFDDVSERLVEHKNAGLAMGNVQSSTGSTTPRIVAVTPKRLSEDLTMKFHRIDDKQQENIFRGLAHTAMETKEQAILQDTDSIHITTTMQEDDKDKQIIQKKKDPRGSISTLMDKVHFHPHFLHYKKDDSKSHDIKSGGLIHTAMQTILIDKAQSMIPDTPEPIPIRAEPNFGEIEKRKNNEHKDQHHTNKESTGLVHSALQTMLIDNVQSVLPDGNNPIPIRTGPDYGNESNKQFSHGTEKESTGLVHSALQTMLIDNVQSVLPDSDEPLPIRTNPDFGKESQNHHDNGKEKQSTGLVHSALQTMLIDNVQSVLPNTNEPIPIRTDNDFGIESQKHYESGKEKESTGLVHSALQTMLMDNVQSVLPGTNEPIPIRTDQDFGEESQKHHGGGKVKESTGPIHSALQTILIDNVQSVLSDTKDPIPIRTDQHFGQESQIHHVGGKEKESTGLVHSAMETILIDRMQTMFSPVAENSSKEINVDYLNVTNPINSEIDTKTLISPGLVETAMKTIQMANVPKATASSSISSISAELPVSSKESSPKPKKESKRNKHKSHKRKEAQNDKTECDKTKRLNRQDSIHSVSSAKTSNEDLPYPHKITRTPVLAAFHPVLSGPQLETITSISECSERSIDCSFDRSTQNDSVDPSVGSIERTDSETNSASVCDNSHAACRFDRTEREKDRDRDKSEKGSPRHARHESYGGREPAGSVQNSSLNASSTPMGIHRRSSDSDLSVTPKGGSLNTSAGNNVGSGGGAILRPSMNSNNLDMLEYPFLTMTEYPPGFIVHIGGAVCARSVKLVDGGGESALRAAWWAELRTELRAHARALRCNAVIAYRDTAAICEDVCVLSASGTAVVINLDCDFNADLDASITVANGKPLEELEDSCCVAHVPYSPGAGPYRAELSTCGGCRRARVPAVLLAACAKPHKLTAYPKAVTLTAVAARIRRAPPTGEPGARDISDQLPFLEYELHKLLLAKLKMQGANALFSLQTQIAIGERCVMALASGTAVKLTALPPPTPPRIKASEKEKDAIEMQKALWDTFTANKAANGYDVGMPDLATIGALPEVEREDPPALDLCADKDACVLELDEAEDVETARALAKRRLHMPALTSSLRHAAGAQPLAFTQVSRARLVATSGVAARAGVERQVARALDGAAYKLRRLAPAALSHAFQLELPEDEIQLVVSGTAIPLADPSKVEQSENGHSHTNSQTNSQSSHSQNNSQTDDDIFELDEEQMMKPVEKEIVEEKSTNGQVGCSVSLTTLSQVGVGRRARRLCALRLLFVRETTAVRELGGLSGFLHTFTYEVLAILRAYTAALGGNALTSFYITQLMLQDNAHKNQGQCLLSVGGDVIHVSY